MSLTRLSLTDFRSYPDALILPGPGLVVLTGENGAGKTNILEAVSLLTPGRGLRGAPLAEMARHSGAGGFAIAGHVGDVSLGTGALAATPERRVVRINGVQSPATGLSEWLSAIWLTPAMDRLFTEGAGDRRRFLDRLVLALEPSHASHANRYEAAMRQRNRLLAEEGRADADWLSALEEQMANHGSLLHRARGDVVLALSGRIAGQPEGPFARAGLTLDGWAESTNLASLLRESRGRDAAAGRALIGPHRVDLLVRHLEKAEPAHRCSTGEQKALLLGLVLAHADLVTERLGRRPILLLDEVAAHLDPRRRGALFQRLQDGGGQVWMTGTENGLFAQIGGAAVHLKVEAGRVTSSG